MPNTPTPAYTQVEPVMFQLSNADACRHFFDASPETILRWHQEDGFPIRWTGKGNGRRGWVVLEQARQWLRGAGIYKRTKSA